MSLHPSGDAAIIDRLLTKHQALVKQLKQLLDLLKPQQYVHYCVTRKRAASWTWMWLSDP